MTVDQDRIVGRYVTVDGARIYYDELGEGAPLVCIHTAGSCSLQYHDIMPHLAAAGFRVIALDLPGHGKSMPAPGGLFTRMHDYGEFVWQFITAVSGDAKPVVLGCSIGGHMATHLAALHSPGLRAAIAMEGGAYTPPYDPGQRMELHASPGWRSYMEPGTIAACHHPLREGLAERLAWWHRFAPQESAVSDLLCWVSHDVRDRMRDVTCPYLNIRGAADWFLDESTDRMTFADLREGVGELQVIDNVGHYPHVEQPAQIAATIRDFITRRAP